MVLILDNVFNSLFPGHRSLKGAAWNIKVRVMVTYNFDLEHLPDRIIRTLAFPCIFLSPSSLSLFGLVLIDAHGLCGDSASQTSVLLLPLLIFVGGWWASPGNSCPPPS